MGDEIQETRSRGGLFRRTWEFLGIRVRFRVRSGHQEHPFAVDWFRALVKSMVRVWVRARVEEVHAPTVA